MGHVGMGRLPPTRKWKQLVAYIGGGAGAAQVAAVTLDAAEKALAGADLDIGVVETIWMLMQLPHAARADDFAVGLRDCGLDVPDDPGLLDVTAAAVEAKTPNCRGRTDLGELARMALGESLSAV